MSIKSTLLGAAALYALGRMTHDLSAEDVQGYASSLSGIDTDDLRKYAWGAADDALLRMGLQRTATVPSSTLLIMGGVGAGLLVGAGLAFYLMSDNGQGAQRSTGEAERSTNGSETAAGTA